jgi:transposase
MPWSETSAMDEKVRFIGDYQRDLLSVAELCDRYRISRKTGYKWIDRYETEGPTGLRDLSRRPHACPHQTPSEVTEPNPGPARPGLILNCWTCSTSL